MTLRFPLRRFPVSMAAPLTVATVLALTMAAGAQTSPSPAGGSLRIEPFNGDFVTTGRTNVRQQPSAQAPRVGRIEAGTKVHVTGKVADAPWYAIVGEDGKTGFIVAEQLRPTPVPAAPTAAAPPPAEATLRERLDKIESALADINQQLPGLKDLNTLSDTVKALLDREIQREKEAIEAPRPPAEPDATPTLLERMVKLQEQIAAQINAQQAEFGHLSDRLDSVETSVQPMIDWAKRWSGSVTPAAAETRSWLSSVYTGTLEWVASWVSWWNAPAQPPAPQPPKP